MSSRRTRILSIRFDRKGRPLRATISTKFGIVRAKWKMVTGDWCWFCAGTINAKQEAQAAIEHVEQIALSMN
jgi:hypothetical protein